MTFLSLRQSNQDELVRGDPFRYDIFLFNHVIEYLIHVRFL